MEKLSPSKHLGYLDGLRGIAALFVVLHHAYLQVADKHPLGGTVGRALQVFFFGRYAVDLFIVLSGFCLMLPIVKGDGRLRGGALQFFQRRAWRILPTYYLAMIFSAILAVTFVSQKTGTHWDVSIPVTWKSIFQHVLMIHDATNQGALINHAFWSVAVEWRIYFIFPLLLWLWTRVGEIQTTLLTIISSYTLFYFYRRIQDQGLTAYYLGLFAMGMLAASIAFSTLPRHEKWRKLSWNWLLFLATLAVFCAAFLKMWRGEKMPYYLQDGVVGAWAMCLLVQVSLIEEGWIHRLLNFRLLVFLGTFAYSIYLVHAPLLQVCWQYLFSPLQSRPLPMFFALALIGTPLILLICYLFFWCCERPFLRRKARVSQSLEVATALSPAP